MRLKTLLLTILTMLLLGATTSWAQYTLKGSKHDFTTWTTGTVTLGLCTACHTPHKASGTRLLWNHALSANTFQWTDVTSTIGGTQLPTIDPVWTGPTKYCLSCHDGSVALGDLNWFDETKQIGTSINNTKITGAAQTATAAGVMNGNHPVAFPYPYGQAKNTYNGVTTGNMVPLTEFVPNPMASNGIRLFNTAGGSVSAGVSAGRTGMECSSCHDPHNGANVQDQYFLLGKINDNASGPSGYICFKCHAK
jgi:hypothetical protein